MSNFLADWHPGCFPGFPEKSVSLFGFGVYFILTRRLSFGKIAGKMKGKTT